MVRVNSKSGETCARCGKNKMLTDNTTGEKFCGKCGFVVSEKSQESGPEWRAFTQDESGNRARTGAPTSLTMHDDRKLFEFLVLAGMSSHLRNLFFFVL